MGDDKQLDLDFTLSSDTTCFDYTYSDSAGSTVGGGIAPSDHTFSINLNDITDTGTEWSYNQPTITFGDTSMDHEVGGAMRKRLEAIESRLNILVPDPEKLEKFEALQKAYEHYKHLERLCEIDDEDEDERPNW